MSNLHSDDEYDEYEAQYGSGYRDEDEDNDFHSKDDIHSKNAIRNMQTVSENLQILNSYPGKTALRVYFEGINPEVSIDNIFNSLSDKARGIVNIIPEGKGSGHLVVDCAENAKTLVKLEGEAIAGSTMRFDLEPAEELIKEPLSEDEKKPRNKVVVVSDKAEKEKPHPE